MKDFRVKVIAAAICAVLVGLAILGLYRVYDVAQFTLRAEKTQGIVVDFVKGKVGSGKHRATVSFPVIEYRTASGENVRFRASHRGNLSQGENVPILYDPDLPEVASVDSFSQLWLDPLWFAGLAVPVGGLVIWVLLRVWAKLRLHKWLRQHGRRIQAKFVGVETGTNWQGPRHPFWHIVTEWEDPSDRTDYRFRSDRFRYDPSLFVKTKTVAVTIDPKNPNRYMMDLSFLPD